MTERMETAPKQRISVYCIAESLDRKLLQKKLEARGPMFMVTQYPDVLYGHYFSLETGQSMGDMCASPSFLSCLQYSGSDVRSPGFRAHHAGWADSTLTTAASPSGI